jgi:hypothetical protein
MANMPPVPTAHPLARVGSRAGGTAAAQPQRSTDNLLSQFS